MADISGESADSSRVVGLRFTAVAAAAGPVLLTSLGVGRGSARWFCSETYAGPFVVDNPIWEFLFWAELLLPAVLAVLLLRRPRRATSLAIVSIGAVFALGLFTAILLPVTDPCTGGPVHATLPWRLTVCYATAVTALLMTRRATMSGPRQGVAVWAVALGTAAWMAATGRMPTPVDEPLSPGLVYGWSNYVAVYKSPDSWWFTITGWASDAKVVGLPVVIVALAAAAKAVLPDRLERRLRAGAGVLLLLLALLNVVGCAFDDESYTFTNLIYQANLPLLLAAVLTAWDVWMPQRWRPSMVSARRLRGKIPMRSRDLAVLLVVAIASIWLAISSFTPSSG